MRENRFLIRSTNVGAFDPSIVDGTRANDHFPRLVAIVEAAAGPDVAALFSEPVTPQGAGADIATVSWYGAFDGRAMEIDAIDAVARAPIVAKLTQRLEKLAPLFQDAEAAPLLAAALSVPSGRDILALGGEPVIVNWGYRPQGLSTGDQRIAQFAATIGRYAPALVPVMTKELKPVQPASVAEASAPVAPLGTMAAATPVAPEKRLRDESLFAPMVATLVAAAVLLLLLIPGVLIYPDGNAGAVGNGFEEARLKKTNDSLEAQLRALEDAARTNVCRADGHTIPVPGLPQDGAPNAPVPKMEAVPRPPENVPLPHSNADPSPANNVANLLDKSVVLVVAFSPKKDGSFSHGSGFFIGDRLVVTNHHVVAGEDENLVFVASHEHRAIRHARVVAKSMPPPDPARDTGADFAVLEVEPFDHPTFLKLGTTPPKLSTVYIAGFPGFLTERDTDFNKMLAGLVSNMRADNPEQALLTGNVPVPGPDMRYGRINNTMKVGDEEFPVIIHDMQLAPGNSGGPLVDACGRVGGVNTLIFRSGKAGGQQGNIALDVGPLRKFLTDQHIAFTADDAPCGPSVADNTRPPAPTPDGPGAPTPPAPAK